MKPIERLKIFINNSNLSISGFEKKVGLSNNSIQTAIKRNSNLKDETLNTILNSFPALNAKWLLTGEEPMLKSDDQQQVPKTYKEMEEAKVVLMEKLIVMQEKRIKDLEKFIEAAKLQFP